MQRTALAVLGASCCVAQLVVAQGLPPIITTCPTHQAVFVGETAVFTVRVQGTPPFRYQWVRENPYRLIPDATNATLIIPNAQHDDASSGYAVEIHNDYGRNDCNPATLTVLPRAPIPGFLDPTFAAPVGFTRTIIPLPDGSMLVSGAAGIARLRPDGSADPGFAVVGAAISGVTAMARQSDGHLIVASGGVLRRLAPDGTVDPNFTVDLVGGIPFVLAVRITAIAVQPDDRILIASQILWAGSEDDYWHSPLVRRLTPTGQPDDTFPITNLSCGDVGILAATTDGILIGAGDTLRRLRLNGEPDAGFMMSMLGPERTHCSKPSRVECLTLQSDGKILIGGSFTTVQGQNRSHVARLHSNGALDASFEPPVSEDQEHPAIHALALQSDGRILAGGRFHTMNGTPREGLARLEQDGSIDPSFVPGEGLLSEDENRVESIAIQSSNRAIVGGSIERFWGSRRLGLARVYLEAGAADQDGDTLPDTWETYYFQSFNAPNGGPDSDADGDGMSNRNELLAGTRPQTASNALRISVERGGASVALRFPTVFGRQYQIESATDLANPRWDSNGSTISGDGWDYSIVITADSSAGRFYRVRLVRAD